MPFVTTIVAAEIVPAAQETLVKPLEFIVEPLDRINWLPEFIVTLPVCALLAVKVWAAARVACHRVALRGGERDIVVPPN